jgi:hypothetical protein
MTKARERVLGRPDSAALEGHRINEGRIDEPRPATAIAWVNFATVVFFLPRIAASRITKPLLALQPVRVVKLKCGCRPKRPSSAANRNPPKPYGRSAPWNGSPSRKNRAEPHAAVPAPLSLADNRAAGRDNGTHRGRGPRVRIHLPPPAPHLPFAREIDSFAFSPSLSHGGLRVRIPLPPAESHVAQCWMTTGGKRCRRWVWSGGPPETKPQL